MKICKNKDSGFDNNCSPGKHSPGNNHISGASHETVFNPLLIRRHELESFSVGRLSYSYKNYAISFTIEAHCGYPHRVLSVTPHGFDPKPMPDAEVRGILAYFGFYDFLPIENRRIEHPDDPYMGVSRCYRQMVMDLDDLNRHPFAVGA